MSDDPSVVDDVIAEDVVSEETTSEDVPPSGEESGEAGTMFDAVSAALSENADDKPDETAAEKQAAEPAEPAEDPNAELSDIPDRDEMSQYAPKTQRRIKKLLAERHALREEVEMARPIIERMQADDIPHEDVDVILNLAGSLRKGDFQAFLQGVAPYVELAQRYTGKAMAPELQQRVQSGQVPADIAQQLTAQQTQAAWAKYQADQQRQAAAKQQADMARSQIVNTVNQWEAHVRQQDPQYDQKADMVRRVSQALIQERGAPRSQEEALQYAQYAYQEASRWMQSAAPSAPPPPVSRPQPSGVNTPAAGGARPEPKSLFDVAQQALAATR